MTRLAGEGTADLKINGIRLKTLYIDDACRHLGYWSMGNGDMSATCRHLGYWGTGNGYMRATREIVRGKARVTRNLIKTHPLTPELSAELFAQRGFGAFRFPAALVEWSKSELEGLQKNLGTSV